MKINKLKLKEPDFPEVLRTIAGPPEELYTSGTPLYELMQRPRVAIVGSRKVSPYGREATLTLARKLAERGIVIVSGLAIGVDSLAHRGALEAGGTTLAVLPGPLDKIYPAGHFSLAQQILQQGGTLVSEYPAGTPIYKHQFIARNRLISGLADAVLITEAAEKSGSLHTARFALEQGKDVLAVPGSITSPTSEGANNLIKAGAALVTSYIDVLNCLGIEDKSSMPLTPLGANAHEQLLIELITQGIRDGELLQQASKLDVALFNQTLTMLEITGKVRSLGANRWALN